jgi:hypothetical protein
MRTILLTYLLGILLFNSLQAQSYTENFESYNENDRIAVVAPSRWVTWSNTPGSSEDAPVVTERANSGSKSLKLFNTSPSGGPMDVVLRFGQKYSTGYFTYEMYMFVEEGKAAYFNFQRENAIGTAWALDVNFNKDGSMQLATGAVRHYQGRFPTGQWFKIRFDINLDKNMWKMSIDDDCRIVFSNSTNALASLNLYPTGDGGSVYFVDDISFQHTSTSPPVTKDVGISSLTWNAGKVVGSKNLVKFKIKNNGSSVINDISVILQHNSKEFRYDYDEIDIMPGFSFDLDAEDEIILEEGLNIIAVRFANIDGTLEDDEVCNNELKFEIVAIKPAPHKAVLAEEATGTWCVWCPRGAVYMDLLNSWYKGLFIPIAVHNNDPMTVTVYDQLIRATPGFTGFPSSVINRKSVMDPSAMETPFLNEISKETIVAITTGAKWDFDNRVLDISANLEALATMNGEYWLTAVLTEDFVRGTGTGWSQANAYAGGGNGPMGGYEALPNPVPANLMRYDHVARAISGPSKTPANTFTANLSTGEHQIMNFTMNIPVNIDMDNTHITIMVFGPAGYENAQMVSIEKALENGFLVNNKEISGQTEVLELFPNPSSDETYLRLHPNGTSDIQVQIINVNGQIVHARNYGKLTGEHLFPINTNNLPSGIYVVQVEINGNIQTKKLQVK